MKLVDTCDKHIKISFIEKMNIIAKNPHSAINTLDIKIIVGVKNHYRLRIWDYRFIFSVNDNELIILFAHADSRGWIYKKLK